MKTKLTLILLTLAVGAVPAPAQTFSKECYIATQQCEHNRLAYFAGCKLTGGSDVNCSISAQGYYLNCLGATGCYAAMSPKNMLLRVVWGGTTSRLFGSDDLRWREGLQ